MHNVKQPGLHVAIIMDGNGRWATHRNLPRVAGHRAGVAAVRRAVEHAPTLDIRTLTLYAFSSDNWARPAQEVKSIFWIIRAFLRLECERLRQQGVRLEAIGRRDRIPKPLLQEIERTESLTSSGTTLNLRIAIDYSARNSIAEAAANTVGAPSLNRRSDSRVGDHEQTVDRMRAIITQTLTADSGDVDLLIRTGGEKRLSDYLLWESAYAELFFTDRMWPDFDASDLEAAVHDFRHRERRFGTVSAPVPQSSPLLIDSAQ